MVYFIGASCLHGLMRNLPYESYRKIKQKMRAELILPQPRVGHSPQVQARELRRLRCNRQHVNLVQTVKVPIQSLGAPAF